MPQCYLGLPVGHHERVDAMRGGRAGMRKDRLLVEDEENITMGGSAS